MMMSNKLISMITNLGKKIDKIDRKLNNYINNNNNSITPYHREFTMDEFNVVLTTLRNNYLEDFANSFCPDILLVRYSILLL